jgi:CubicO group peptidase (beta-lactamase class C family)
MCKIIFVFCCLLALNSGGFAQIPEAIAIDSIFADWDHPDVPGGSVGVMRNGELIFSKGYGMANLDYDIPNSPTTSFEIGSTSKQFTAACIILLIQRDSLSFESTLHEFFPQFPDYAKKITVRHLLNHMSGVRDYIYLFVHKGIWVDGDYTDEDIMNMLARQESINFEPGEICSLPRFVETRITPFAALVP